MNNSGCQIYFILLPNLMVWIEIINIQKLVTHVRHCLSDVYDILNSSYAEGVVPTQWKKAIVVPIPKTNPPKCDKLRPVSLSNCFAKVAETFITDWILEDISDKIDLQQYGNVKGVSTSHYLVSLLHFLHQGADKVNNVGTVVLTDFSKAFDMVDHNLLIEKFIHIGVRRSIVPWLCDFFSNVCSVLDTILLFLILQLYLPVYHKALN